MPYTLGLLKSIPRMDSLHQDKLLPIKGSPPDLLDLPQGCPFVPRCDFVLEPCSTVYPQLRHVPILNPLAENTALSGLRVDRGSRPAGSVNDEDYEKHVVSCHNEVTLANEAEKRSVLA